MAISAPAKHEKFTIRKPNSHDFESLLSIERRCFRAHRFTLDDFRYHLYNPSSIFALAERSGTVVGYIAGVVHQGPKNRVARIYSMAVLPEWRKHGLGSTLLNYFGAESVKRGCQLGTLEVRRSNRSALSLYVRSGYRIDKVLKDYYAPGSDGLLMRKELSADNA